MIKILNNYKFSSLVNWTGTWTRVQISFTRSAPASCKLINRLWLWLAPRLNEKVALLILYIVYLIIEWLVCGSFRARMNVDNVSINLLIFPCCFTMSNKEYKLNNRFYSTNKCASASSGGGGKHKKEDINNQEVGASQHKNKILRSLRSEEVLIDLSAASLLEKIKSLIINIFCIAFIIFLLYKFYIELTISGLYGCGALVMSFVVFFTISYFILSKFKYSNNIIISFLQRIILINVVVTIVSIIFGVVIYPEVNCLGDNEVDVDKTSDSNNNSKETVKGDIKVKGVIEEGKKEIYDVHVKLDKNTTDQIVKTVVKEGAKTLVPAIGAGTAAGHAAAATIKATAGMPPLQRAAAVGGVSALTGAATVVGINTGISIVANSRKAKEIKNNTRDVENVSENNGGQDIDRIPSPDNTFINSPYEENIPLLVLLNTIYTYNQYEFLLLIILLFVLFNKNISKLNINIVSRLINKYILPWAGGRSERFIVKFEKYTSISKNYNDKFAFIMFIFVIILYVLIKIINFLIIAELNNNIEDYVLVYNHYKNIDSGDAAKGDLLYIIGFKSMFSVNWNTRVLRKKCIVPTEWNLACGACGDTKDKFYCSASGPEGSRLAQRHVKEKSIDESECFATSQKNKEIDRENQTLSVSAKGDEGGWSLKSFAAGYNLAIWRQRDLGTILSCFSKKRNVRFYSSSSKDISVSHTKGVGAPFGRQPNKEARHSKDSSASGPEGSSLAQRHIIEIIDRDSEVIAKNLYEYLTTIHDLLPLYSVGTEQDKDLEIKNKISSIFDKFLRYYKVSGIKSKDLNKLHENYRLKIKNIRKGKVNYKFNDELKRDYPYVWQVLNNFNEWIIKYNIRPLRDKYMSNFINSAIKLISLDNKGEDYIINICDSVENDVKEVIKNKSKLAYGRLNPNRLKGLTPTDYSKLIWLKLLHYSSDMDSQILKILKNKIDIIDKKSESKSTQLLLEIEDKLNNLFSIRDQILFIRPFHIKKLDYDRESMQNVAARHELLIERKEEVVNIEKLKDLQKDLENYNQFMKDLEYKVSLSKEEKYADDGLLASIKNILSLNNLSLEDKQLSIEKLCLSNDQNWFDREFQSMKDSTNQNYSVESLILHDLYKSTIENLTIILNEYINNNFRKLRKGLLKGDNESYAALIMISLGPNLVLNLGFTEAIKTILKVYKDGANQTHVMSSVGNSIITQMKWMFFKSSNFKSISSRSQTKDIRSIIRSLKGRKLEEFTNIFNQYIKKIEENVNGNVWVSFHIGQTIVSLLLSKEKVFKRKLNHLDNKTSEVIITLNPNYEHKMNISIMSSTHLPMLVTPNPPDNEGNNYLPYLSGEISHIVNTFDRLVKDNYKNKYPTENLKGLVKTMISLNNVPFKINKLAYNIFMYEWNKSNSLLFKGYNKKLDIKENDTAITKNDKKAHNSIYWQYFNILQIAGLYLNYKFYLPTFADFRGRIYCFSSYLSYQGNDLARALLLFDEGDKILTDDGLTYMKVYFSNLAGQDKHSWNEKLIWADSNLSDIYSKFLINKVDSLSKISELKEPFQFISILLALGQYNLETREGKKTKKTIYNPILFDASCNGIQHLASMTRDIELAKKTNVISPKPEPDNNDHFNLSDKQPEDLYTYAAELVEKELPKEGIYTNIKITRKFVKRSVMTIPYNISIIGVQNQIIEHSKHIKELNKNIYILPSEFSKDGKEIRLTYNEIINLGNIVYSALNSGIPSLSLLKEYLEAMVNILLKLGLWVYWITPNGLKVNLSTIKLKSHVLKSRLYSGNNPITITLPTKQFNNMAIKRSVMPNLIHSLDATNIQLFINKMEKPIPFYTIHDCFASLPNNMRLLEYKIKEAFIEIYFKDINYVVLLHQQLIKQIKSAATIGTDSSGEEYITILSKKGSMVEKRIIIPQLPKAFTDENLTQYFIKGLRNSRYFIG